jgi:hypothetical protein
MEDATFNNSELVYDLRQTRVKIIEAIKFRVYQFKIQDDYSNWLKELRNLYTVINHKILAKEEKEYEELLSSTLKTISENRTAFLKQDRNPEKVESIYRTLSNLEMWLWKMMEKHRLFGYKEDVIL